MVPGARRMCLGVGSKEGLAGGRKVWKQLRRLMRVRGSQKGFSRDRKISGFKL